LIEPSNFQTFVRASKSFIRQIEECFHPKERNAGIKRPFFPQLRAVLSRADPE
jgi:hypothetical protein